MLPLFALSAAIVFFLLWKSGILEDLAAKRRSESPEHRVKKTTRVSKDPDMAKRLRVFEQFVEQMPDEEENE
jgi:hypothetical protein